MKSLILPFLMLATPAMAGEVQIGVGAGVMNTDPLEVLGTTWTVIPRVGYFFNPTLGLEADLGFLKGKTRVGDTPFNYFGLTPRLNVVGRLWATGKRKPDGTTGKKPPIQPILAAGIGGFYKSVNDGEALGKDFNRKDLDFLVNAGPGVIIPIGPAHFRTDLRWVVSLGNENFQNRGDQFVNWEWTAGLGINFGGKPDTDKDGILDADDKCKDEAEDMDNFQDEDGCPEKDNDNDGLDDAADTCPIEPEDKDGLLDTDGCPEDDADMDTVLDEADKCPMEKGSPGAAGCPDQDEDTVVDTEDECADEKGSVKAWGCPDGDEDRVPDYRDQCPDEKADARVNNRYSDGCPSRVVVSDAAIVILEKVFFDTGKATIKAESFPLLADVAGTLTKYKNIKKVAVEGHTDNVGDAASNLKLSDDRAAAVRQHLIDTHAIEADRLVAKGYGQDKPLENNDPNTDEGRAANRRVEFNIVDIDKATRPTFTRAPVKLKKVEFVAPAAKDPKKLLPKAIIAMIPEDTGVTQDVTCTAVVRIGVDGRVEEAKMAGCVGLPRSIVRRSMLVWAFEPMLVDGAAKAHQAMFNWTFKDGTPTVVLDEVSVQPVE